MSYRPAFPLDWHTELTVEQYFVLESDSEIRREYYHGEIIARTGLDRNHVMITGSVHGELRAQLAKRPNCGAFASDLRVRVSSKVYFYPDVVVACDEQYTDSTELVLTNPALIVEVTSESTALYDRLTKLEAYKQMPSVQEILIIDQRQVRVEQHTRMANGWFVQEFTGEHDRLTLQSLDCTLALNEVYAKVTFSE